MRRRLRLAAAASMALVSSCPLSAASAAATGGVAQIVGAPSAGGGALASGGSATTFGLKLPRGAACSGDSADGNYKIQSYMVPAADDPGTLVYRSQGPTGPGRRPLYDVGTSAYVNAQTSNGDTKGGPGLVLNVPLFSFAVFTPGDIAPGAYDIGIACTLFNQVDTYWSARITIRLDGADAPAGITWKAVGAPSAAPSTSSSRPLVVVTGVVLLMGAGVVLLRRSTRGAERARQPPVSLGKETR